MLEKIKDRIVFITLMLGAVSAATGAGVAWSQNNLPVPATRQYVQDQIKEPTKRLIDIQIYQATSEKRALSKEIDDRREQLGKQAQEEAKAILRDKIRELQYEIDRADDDIRNFKIQRDLHK